MATVLEEFLIKLGFQVDPAQHSRFQDAMKQSHSRVEAFNKSLIGVIDRFANLATVATGAAAGLSDALNKIGHHMAGLSFAAERIGSSPEKITAYENAIKMLGGTVEGARASLETVARAQRENPGILQAMFGVKPGTDPVTAMREIGQHFASLIKQGPMGMAQALAEAKQIGLDQADVLRISNQNFETFYTEAQTRVARWGADMDKAAALGREQEQNLDRLKQHFQGFTTYLYETFGPTYVHGLDVVNHWFDENSPKIKTHIDNLKTDFDGLTGGLSEMFKSLSPKEQAGVEIGGVVAGGALAARVGGSIVGRAAGMVGLGGVGKLTGLGLFAAVLGGLINDFETWKKDSSQSFIDWSAWEPSITAATNALQHFNKDIIGPMTDSLGIDQKFIPAFELFAVYLATKFVPSVALSFGKAALSAGGFGGKLGAISAALLAIEAWRKMQDPTVAKDWAPDSPFWQGMSEEEQRKYPNSPLNQGARQENSPSFWKSPWDWTKRRLGFGSGSYGAGGATDERKAQVRDQLSQDLNISKDAASGIVSNINAESGISGINEKNPLIPGTRGGFGWAQWTGPRRDQYEAWSAQHHLDPASDAANYGFLVEEIRNKYPDILAQLQAGKITPTQAANIFFKYESGGDARVEAHREGHVAGAEQIARLPSAAPVDTTPAAAASAAPTDQFTLPDGLASPEDLGPQAAPAIPSPAQQMGMVSNDNSKSIQVSDNSVVNVTGVSDPDRAANLVNRNRDRVNANVARHLGSLYG